MKDNLRMFIFLQLNQLTGSNKDDYKFPIARYLKFVGNGPGLVPEQDSVFSQCLSAPPRSINGYWHGAIS